MPKDIQVTKTYLPDKQEYLEFIDKIWESGWLTNNGTLSIELETQLKEYLDVPFVKFVSSGTTALQLAINALDLKGEIITTPYSYIATTSAIIWQNCKPIFVDIGQNSFNIDADKIEEKITAKTTAIIATHVYGIPCDVKKIEILAKKYDLKLIYDGAHSFGVKLNDKSIFEYGDISICSLHATKVFHTTEGGAIITKDHTIDKKIFLNRAFGHIGDDHKSLGINGKNSEFHAAMGLCNLPKVEDRMPERREVFEEYKRQLDDLPLETLNLSEHLKFNYGYFPVVFEASEIMDTVKSELERIGVFPRRYFYPSINTIEYVNGGSCPRSESISSRILCLPLFNGLESSTIQNIIEVIKKSLQHG